MTHKKFDILMPEIIRYYENSVKHDSNISIHADLLPHEIHKLAVENCAKHFHITEQEVEEIVTIYEARQKMR